MQERPTGKNLPVYASLSTMRQEPSQSEMNNGVIPLDTLPAAWWNWMWNAITQAQNDSMYNDDVLFTEINNVLTEAGITPGTSSQHDQLRQAINVIKGTIATTAEAGSVLSTDSGTTGTVKVAADGRMTVNNFGDIASFHGASKDNLMSALNETYDIAYGSNDSVGELSALTTTARGTLVDAVNELNAGKAPTMHASAETTHGIGNADNYGHVKLTDTPGSADAASGTAATPKLVRDMVGGGLGAINAVSYTFVVDSNEKLAEWANNDTSKGQDYTSVLIKRGTWNSTIGVNLTTAGTKVVVGEAVSKLVFNNVEKGLYYDTVPTEPDYYMRGVAVEVTATGIKYRDDVHVFYYCNNLTNCTGVLTRTGTGTDGNAGRDYGYVFYFCNNLTNCTGTGTVNSTRYAIAYVFYYCKNLTNCTGTGTGNSARTGSGAGFSYCLNLSNCTGTGTATGNSTGSNDGDGFTGCKNLTNCTGTGKGTCTGTGTGIGTGFGACNRLTNCTGTGTGESGTGSRGRGFSYCLNLSNCTGTGTGESGYGFDNCKAVIGCEAGANCTTAVFDTCYASNAKTSTYACADTPNGGFNDTTNPKA